MSTATTVRAAGAIRFDSLMSAGLLTRVNRLPVMLGGSTVEERGEDERYDFMDDNLTFDRIERQGTQFAAGDRLSYWIAARDLLGQNGAPTNPIDVVVQDRKAPPIPRGLKTIEERVGDDRRIQLQWDSNADGDTVVYDIYRYRYYHHAGRPGPPFDDDAEFSYTVTEGFITAVAEPLSATVSYRDMEISVADDEGRAYWYCVAAVDAAGNRSPLSPPVRGVLYDRYAPDPPSEIQLCTYRYECEAAFNEEKKEANTGSVEVVFNVERMDNRIVEARVVKLGAGKPDVLFHGPFGSDTVKTVTDTIRLDSASIEDDTKYVFAFRTSLGEWCGPFELPRELMNGMLQSKSTRHTIRVRAFLHVKQICVDGLTPDRVPHDPYAEGGGNTPLEITVTLTDDAVGAILYRALDCEEFQRVTTVRADEGDTTVTLVDTLRPGSVAVMCYGIRLFDENQNMSGMEYLGAHVIFEGDDTVQPVIDSVTALGTAASPEARVKWFGPVEGVAGYRLHFATGTIAKAGALGLAGIPVLGSATGVTSVYPIDELSYQESTGIWSVRIATLDDVGSMPLETNTAYRVWVEAIDDLGSTIEGRDTRRFTWSDEEAEEERLLWPVRPLPDQTDGPAVYVDRSDADGVIRGIAVELTDPALSGNKEINPLEIMKVETPFIVYRQRTDISNQPFVQIGPLIEKIETDASGNIQDPFILRWGSAAYYMDYVGLVHGAKYRYVIIELDESGELSLVRGPTLETEVTFE